MRTGPGRPRRARRALALAAAALLAAVPLVARADDDTSDLSDRLADQISGPVVPGQLRVIRVGDQTLLVDEVGNAILYQDPTPPAVMCEDEMEACVTIEVPAGAGIVVPGAREAPP